MPEEVSVANYKRIKSYFDKIFGIIFILLLLPFFITISIREEDSTAYLLRDSVASKPGITGLWQIYGDRRKGIDNLIALEYYYEKKISFKLDLKIFAATIPVILLGVHSDAILTMHGNKNKTNLARQFFSINI